MGLSSKQVSSDGQDWNQSLLQQSTNSTSNIKATEVSKQQQQLTPAKRHQQNQQQQHLVEPCPRCESTNTKFCYYNNYNKSQPRHFCKACKRHWTKGGTLRNVPVGGGRKNKRLRRTSNHSSNIAASATAKTTSATPTPSTATADNTKSFLEKSNNMINHHHINGFAFPQLLDHKSMISRGSPTSMLGDGFFNRSTNLNLKSLYNNMFLDSSALSSLPLDHHHPNIDLLHHRFPYTNLQTSFDHSNNNTPCSVTSAMSNSFQSSPILYNYAAGHESTSTSALEETVMAGLETSNISGSSGSDHQQQRPWTPTTTTTTTAATTAMTTSISSNTNHDGLISTPENYVTTNWGWDDIDKFASVDITIPWDDDIDINL